MTNDPKSEIKRALKAAEQAHHQAFLDQDGHDPDWPIWYADYLLTDLRRLLSAEPSQSELVYLLLSATYKQQADAPGQAWSEFTARFLVDRYGLA